MFTDNCVSSTRLMGERDLLDECLSSFNLFLSPSDVTWEDHSLRHVHVGSEVTLPVNVQTSDIGREGKKKKAGQCSLPSGVLLCHPTQTHTHLAVHTCTHTVSVRQRNMMKMMRAVKND